MPKTRAPLSLEPDNPLVSRVAAPLPPSESTGIQLSRADYLGLRGHPAIAQAQADALQGLGDDIYMSAAYLGDTSSQRALERQFARFLGAEDGVLCQSGWCANIGLVQTVADESTPVYLDACAHPSWFEGARSAGAPIHVFAHNDAASLRRLAASHGPGLVAVEAVYGANGDRCELGDIIAENERAGCQIVVDESHSLGVVGRLGQGLVARMDLLSRVTYRTFSFSKSLCARIGMVTGPARIMEFLRYESRPAIFSSAVLPYEVAGLRVALEMIQEEEWRRRLLQRHTNHLRGQFFDLGYRVAAEGSQIIPIHTGPRVEIELLQAALKARGVFGAPYHPPSAVGGPSVLRLLVSARLNDDDLKQVAEKCAEINDLLSMLSHDGTRERAPSLPARGHHRSVSDDQNQAAG